MEPKEIVVNVPIETVYQKSDKTFYIRTTNMKHIPVPLNIADLEWVSTSLMFHDKMKYGNRESYRVIGAVTIEQNKELIITIDDELWNDIDEHVRECGLSPEKDLRLYVPIGKDNEYKDGFIIEELWLDFKKVTLHSIPITNRVIAINNENAYSTGFFVQLLTTKIKELNIEKIKKHDNQLVMIDKNDKSYTLEFGPYLDYTIILNWCRNMVEGKEYNIDDFLFQHCKFEYPFADYHLPWTKKR